LEGSAATKFDRTNVIDVRGRGLTVRIACTRGGLVCCISTTTADASFSRQARCRSRADAIEAAVALIALGRPGIENETCVRLRIRDTLLYRRPVIVDPYGTTADYVRRTGIGLVARSLEKDDVSEAARTMLFDDRVRRRCVEAIETERHRCITDERLVALLQVGDGAAWRPTRSRERKLAAMDALAASTDTFIRPFEV
jgi:hypothetical protein